MFYNYQDKMIYINAKVKTQLNAQLLVYFALKRSNVSKEN